MKITENEKDLLEAIRNFRNSKQNDSNEELEFFIRELFEKLLEEDESNTAK